MSASRSDAWNPAARRKRSALRAEFRRERRVILDDFLPAELAEAILRTLRRLDAEPPERRLWCRTRHGDPVAGELAFACERLPVANLDLDTMALSIGSAADARRLLARGDDRRLRWRADHPLARAARLLSAPATHDFVRDITGARIADASAVVFASRHGPGDFISVHTDRVLSRRVAFILQLTRDWVVHWGGNLVFLDRRRTRIAEALIPKFNSLALFDVDVPHAVLPIAPEAPQPRFVLGGWYHQRGFARMDKPPELA